MVVDNGDKRLFRRRHWGSDREAWRNDAPARQQFRPTATSQHEPHLGVLCSPGPLAPVPNAFVTQIGGISSENRRKILSPLGEL